MKPTYRQLLFSSRSYTLLHSMVGYWHHHVIRLSVHLSVTLCILAPRVGVQE